MGGMGNDLAEACFSPVGITSVGEDGTQAEQGIQVLRRFGQDLFQ
nr:hypothetical protein [Geotalea toluenoxydans]